VGVQSDAAVALVKAHIPRIDDVKKQANKKYTNNMNRFAQWVELSVVVTN
jgi:hypothetical protein